MGKAIQHPRATIDDLHRLDGKAELIGGRIVHFIPTGSLPNVVADLDNEAKRADSSETGTLVLLRDVDLIAQVKSRPKIIFTIHHALCFMWDSRPRLSFERNSRGRLSHTDQIVNFI